MSFFASKPPRSRLLDLPAEIREHIFTFVVVPDKKTMVTFCLDRFQKESYEEASQPPITRVSRQVRRETVPLFYECNEFVIHTDDQKAEDAQRWLQHNRAQLSKIRHLALWVRFHPGLGSIAPPRGVIGVYLSHNARTGCWAVRDYWRWITVVRKPAMVEQDGQMLIESLNKLVDGRPRRGFTAEDYVMLIQDLRTAYLKDKRT